jgi:hypothetical protein
MVRNLMLQISLIASNDPEIIFSGTKYQGKRSTNHSLQESSCQDAAHGSDGRRYNESSIFPEMRKKTRRFWKC